MISITIGSKPKPHLPSVLKGTLPRISPIDQRKTNKTPTVKIIIPKITFEVIWAFFTKEVFVIKLI